jgi:hypothetical protein
LLLSELIAPVRRLALVGLAKNTGKTETLRAILKEHATVGRRVGVTSIGHDGEEHDVLDARISKPRINLAAGSIVATTDGLLSSSGISYELLEETGIRTPLGQVLIARLRNPGTIEVAGPSAAEDVRTVSDTMLNHGAEQVLIDGAINRRAASSPAIADGLVMATGAVLSEDIEQVAALTKDAVELVRLPRAGAPADGQIVVGRRLVLNSEPAEIAALLRENPQASTFVMEGALSERFLEGLLNARPERAGRTLEIVVGDPTKVFMSSRSPSWYERQGITIEVSSTIDLQAITVNPVAPQSHRFDSEQLRALIEVAVGDMTVIDVLHPDYLGSEQPTPA